MGCPSVCKVSSLQLAVASLCVAWRGLSHAALLGSCTWCLAGSRSRCVFHGCGMLVLGLCPETLLWLVTYLGVTLRPAGCSHPSQPRFCFKLCEQCFLLNLLSAALEMSDEASRAREDGGIWLPIFLLGVGLPMWVMGKARSPYQCHLGRLVLQHVWELGFLCHLLRVLRSHPHGGAGNPPCCMLSAQRESGEGYITALICTREKSEGAL